jgi:hypothetical protein
LVAEAVTHRSCGDHVEAGLVADGVGGCDCPSGSFSVAGASESCIALSTVMLAAFIPAVAVP